MQELIITKIQELTDNGKLDEIVTKAAISFLQKTCEDVLSSYGDVSKALKEKISKAVLGGVEKLDLVTYTAALNQLIETELNNAYGEYALKPVKKVITSFIGSLEKTNYKLSEIIDEFKEQVSEYTKENNQKITLMIDDASHGSVWIGFDEKSDISGRYECSYTISINLKDKCLWYFSNNKKKISPLTEGQLTGFDLFLFKLYACKCTVEIDEDNCELEYNDFD